MKQLKSSQVKNTKSNSLEISVDSKIWINIGNESFLGLGKIELMEQIRNFGSLTKAAKNMNMSYRKAWGNINKINNIAGKPLVILKRGGKEGGTAEVTEAGEKAIYFFNQLSKEVNNLLAKQKSSLEL